MKVPLIVPLLVALRAVLASCLGYTMDIHGCEPTILQDSHSFSLESVPKNIIALSSFADNQARLIASILAEQTVERRLDNDIGNQTRVFLIEHPDIMVTITSVIKRRDVSVVGYNKNNIILLTPFVANNQKHSKIVEIYWSISETTLNQTTGIWYTSPFWDCITMKWMFGYITPLPGTHSGAIGIFFPVDIVDIDQCNDSFSVILSEGHRCDRQSTQCIPDKGLSTGYLCVCKPGFFSRRVKKFGGVMIGEKMDEASNEFVCLPCPEECGQCAGENVCMVDINYFVRTVILIVQLVFMAFTLVIAVIVFKQRKCKTIASSMWTILETILLGIFLLYATVVVRFFDPSVEHCLLEPWCRELGFVICYGAIILKLYRILIEFRTRKAHRWVVRDKDLLKYLLGMVLVVFGYMAAWTATNLNFIQENYNILSLGRTYEGRQFLACKAVWWDYVTETGEILILVFGIHLSYACRNATTQFQERRFLWLAIAVEAVVSSIFYILRIFYSSTLDPDYSYIAYFLRSQLTNTSVLAVIFLPKLWYHHKSVRDSRGTCHFLTQEFSTRVHLEGFKSHDGVTGTNSSDVEVGEINLAEMNPEEIRAELKRLYTQLEILKNKTICANNPHISKRRGGRKVAHRRFSLQALHRHQHQKSSAKHAIDHEPTEGEVSRTPEDSVCSVEGPSAIYNDAPSTYSEHGISCRGPHKQ